MSRDEVFRKIKAGTLKQNAAAKLLDVSRQRVSQLYAKWNKRQEAPVMNPAPVPAPTPRNNDPLEGIFGEGGQSPEDLAPPVELPQNIKQVLNPLGVPADGPLSPSPQPPESLPPSPSPRISSDDAELAEDAAAGRELLRMGRRLAAEAGAKWAGINPEDPRFSGLKEENEFLKLALKRNSDKAAPLGWLTRGWKGLVIGVGLEVLRVALMAPPGETVPETLAKKAGVKLPDPAPKPAAADKPAKPPVSVAEDATDLAAYGLEPVAEDEKSTGSSKRAGLGEKAARALDDFKRS